MIRLAVVDDHPAIAAAIGAALRDRADIKLVGSVTKAVDAADLVARTDPDILLCDLWLDGEAAGLDVLATFAGPARASGPGSGSRQSGSSSRPLVLVLSGFDQPSFLRAAFEGGAVG
ncbi:MAG: response regulator, partial [Chloroflexota bacterium]|nr:response regulator [Chloroflexota bacterium]